MTATPSPSEDVRPDVISCCICARKVGISESVVEERPTGECWNSECWHYCVDCWIGMKKLRQRSIDPEVLLSILEL